MVRAIAASDTNIYDHCCCCAQRILEQRYIKVTIMVTIIKKRQIVVYHGISATMHFQEFVFKTPSNCPAETTTFLAASRSGRAAEAF